ncbi:hypothetical protein Tco_0909830 [Tanacetum coccineum]|uniref:Uncharacterized protein n=1 Tax=Tanacetum coccineum TaxID=301880 RepID=A0ABQ5CRA3_9ASTR
MFGKETFKATDNKVEINLDAAKELAEKKEFRRAKEHQAIKELAEKKEFRIAKKDLNRRMEEQFTKLGAPTTSMHRLSNQAHSPRFPLNLQELHRHRCTSETLNKRPIIYLIASGKVSECPEDAARIYTLRETCSGAFEPYINNLAKEICSCKIEKPKMKAKKGLWSLNEDQKLRDYVTWLLEYGPNQCSFVADINHVRIDYFNIQVK